ncbi:MAG: hypothetical protein LBC74_04775, partial [Planctomycetaceae bacterium]|nr:hypothetical protein [Planctomycetaceae bacterium]
MFLFNFEFVFLADDSEANLKFPQVTNSLSYDDILQRIDWLQQNARADNFYNLLKHPFFVTETDPRWNFEVSISSKIKKDKVFMLDTV